MLERLCFEKADAELHLRVCLLVLRASDRLLGALWEKPSGAAAGDGSGGASGSSSRSSKGTVAVPSMLNIAYSMVRSLLI